MPLSARSMPEPALARNLGQVSRARRSVAAAVLALVALVLSLWLLTMDVSSDEGKTYGDRPAREDGWTSCGAAYDVVLIRGHGFMGGEVPRNQSAIDEQCVRKAGRLVTFAAVGGTLGLLAAAYALTGLVPGREEPIETDRQSVGTA
jgi:hypothetical protein